MATFRGTTSFAAASSSAGALRPPPPPPPPPPAGTHDYWKRDSASVSAVSFGFVATAVLISLFLIVAIFERFLRRAPASDLDLSLYGTSTASNSSNIRNRALGLFPFLKGQDEDKQRFDPPPASVEISVLMPGQNVPTFIANPVPIPCRREGMVLPSHKKGYLGSCSFDCTHGQPAMKPAIEERGSRLV